MFDLKIQNCRSEYSLHGADWTLMYVNQSLPHIDLSIHPGPLNVKSVSTASFGSLLDIVCDFEKGVLWPNKYYLKQINVNLKTIISTPWWASFFSTGIKKEYLSSPVDQFN